MWQAILGTYASLSLRMSRCFAARLDARFAPGGRDTGSSGLRPTFRAPISGSSIFSAAAAPSSAVQACACAAGAAAPAPSRGPGAHPHRPGGPDAVTAAAAPPGASGARTAAGPSTPDRAGGLTGEKTNAPVAAADPRIPSPSAVPFLAASAPPPSPPSLAAGGERDAARQTAQCLVVEARVNLHPAHTPSQPPLKDREVPPVVAAGIATFGGKAGAAQARSCWTCHRCGATTSFGGTTRLGSTNGCLAGATARERAPNRSRHGSRPPGALVHGAIADRRRTRRTSTPWAPGCIGCRGCRSRYGLG
eukprot:scaffold31599_cov101-Isochrysis_galbana.AAC.3